MLQCVVIKFIILESHHITCRAKNQLLTVYHMGAVFLVSKLYHYTAKLFTVISSMPVRIHATGYCLFWWSHKCLTRRVRRRTCGRVQVCKKPHGQEAHEVRIVIWYADDYIQSTTNTKIYWLYEMCQPNNPIIKLPWATVYTFQTSFNGLYQFSIPPCLSYGLVWSGSFSKYHWAFVWIYKLHHTFYGKHNEWSMLLDIVGWHNKMQIQLNIYWKI